MVTYMLSIVSVLILQSYCLHSQDLEIEIEVFYVQSLKEKIKKNDRSITYEKTILISKKTKICPNNEIILVSRGKKNITKFNISGLRPDQQGTMVNIKIRSVKLNKIPRLIENGNIDIEVQNWVPWNQKMGIGGMLLKLPGPRPATVELTVFVKATRIK